MRRLLNTSLVRFLRVRALPIVAMALVVGAALVLGGCTDDARAAASRTGAEGPAPAELARISNPTVDHTLLHPSSDPNASCTCDDATRRSGWCRRCNVGYVAGLRITSPVLFEGIDPHGHELDNECLQLELCRDVIRTDGFCDAVGFGFVGGRAYFTRLTYGLARAAPVDHIECSACRRLVGRSGWCAMCERGIVGNLAIADRALFEQTAAEFVRLHRAIELSQSCDMCGVAMVAHRACPKCFVSYESQEPTPLSRSKSSS